jgi:hypothetical protein
MNKFVRATGSRSWNADDVLRNERLQYDSGNSTFEVVPWDCAGCRNGELNTIAIQGTFHEKMNESKLQ